MSRQTVFQIASGLAFLSLVLLVCWNGKGWTHKWHPSGDKMYAQTPRGTVIALKPGHRLQGHDGSGTTPTLGEITDEGFAPAFSEHVKGIYRSLDLSGRTLIVYRDPNTLETGCEVQVDPYMTWGNGAEWLVWYFEDEKEYADDKTDLPPRKLDAKWPVFIWGEKYNKTWLPPGTKIYRGEVLLASVEADGLHYPLNRPGLDNSTVSHLVELHFREDMGVGRFDKWHPKPVGFISVGAIDGGFAFKPDGDPMTYTGYEARAKYVEAYRRVEAEVERLHDLQTKERLERQLNAVNARLRKEAPEP